MKTFLPFILLVLLSRLCPAQTTTINDNDNSVIYSSIGGAAGKWSYQTGVSGDYSNDEHYNNYDQTPESTTIMGPVAVENFNGTGIILLGKKGPNFGIGAYSVDGGAWTSVDAYNSTSRQQQPLVTITGLAAGPHVLAYQLTDSKNASSTNIYQSIDAYQITGTALPFSSATVGSYTNGQAVYAGSGWKRGNYATDLSGSHSWDGTAGDSVSWTFTGNLIEVFGRPDTGDGYFDVYIDGTRVAQNVDSHYGTEDNDALTAYLMWSSVLPTNGTHTIKLVVDGTEDSYNGSEDSGQKYLLQFDEFAAWSVSTSAPARPTGLTAAPGNGSVSLNWTSSSGATSYSIYRGQTPSGESSTPVATGVTSTNYNDTGLVNGITYYYKIQAVNSVGSSGYSSEASATPASTGLSGSVAAAASSYNLTTLGTSDWAHWNASFIHDASGGSQISNLTAIGGGTTGTYTSTSRSMTWTNGTPTASGTNDHTYIWCNGAANSGWTFTVPADTTSRTLHVVCGGPGTGASVKLTAHLSDGSSPDYTDAETASALFTNEYTLNYVAASAGQTLTITVVHTNSGSPSCDLDAAWLVTNAPSGALSGTKAAAASSYNLTTLGTADWAHWNGTFIHDASVSSLIRNVTAIGGGTTGTYTATSRNITWTNGTPTTSGTNDHTYIWCNGAANSGWTFTVPADSTARTLHVLCGGPGTGASVKIIAHLSDGSAPDYTDTATGSALFTNEYTIGYHAASSGQTLTITVVHTNSSSASCDLDAAWLISGS